MKRRMLKFFKWLLFLLLIPVVLVLGAFITTLIPVNAGDGEGRDKNIYLSTSGVHLDIALPREHVAPNLMEGLVEVGQTAYFSFGWGDRNFFLNTPTWDDLTFKNGFTALCLPTETLMHLTRYPAPGDDWTRVPISDSELRKLNDFLAASFRQDAQGQKTHLSHPGYSSFDDFYLGAGSYHAFNTCNSWANQGLKESGLKACLWTPFDFGVLWKYAD